MMVLYYGWGYSFFNEIYRGTLSLNHGETSCLQLAFGYVRVVSVVASAHAWVGASKESLGMRHPNVDTACDSLATNKQDVRE